VWDLLERHYSVGPGVPNAIRNWNTVTSLGFNRRLSGYTISVHCADRAVILKGNNRYSLRESCLNARIHFVGKMSQLVYAVHCSWIPHG
jgi:hypothetical protein